MKIIGAMLSMDMITKPEASVLTDMARAGNEYVTAALELYQSGIVVCYYLFMRIKL